MIGKIRQTERFLKRRNLFLSNYLFESEEFEITKERMRIAKAIKNTNQQPAGIRDFDFKLFF